MAKKSKLKFVLADNIPQVKEETPEPIIPEEPVNEVENDIEEEPVETTEVEPFEEPEKEKKTSLIDYKPYTIPIGKAKDNGIFLCIVLCIIIFLLGCLLYQRQYHDTHIPDNNVVVPEYQELTTIIKGYVDSITDSNKEEFCQKLRQHYIDWAAKPVTDINKFLEDNIEEIRIILGFYRGKAISNEWEWHKLFCKGGVIDKWLEKSNVIITPANKKEIFLAIAKGLE